MSKLDTLFSQLHEILTETLLNKIKSGEATSSDLNVARQLLKDNGIDSVADEGSPLEALAGLSVFSDDEDDIRNEQTH